MAEEEDEDLLQEGEIMKERWQVIKKLGAGAFGQVFEVFDINEPETHAALKTEGNDAPVKLLKMDVVVLRALKGKHAKHVPFFYDCGRRDEFNFVVMSLIGKDLDKIRENMGGKLSLSSVLRIAKQCVQSVEDLHGIGFVHRDIKPDNYAIGRDKNARTVYMLDFGLARKFTGENGQIRRPRAGTGFRGTGIYASINALNGLETTRADDLWCLFYSLIELLNGSLPWQYDGDKPKLAKIKKTMPPSKLCKGCPEEFQQIQKILQKLTYEMRPNYDELKKILDKSMIRNKVKELDPYDWELKGGKQTNQFSTRTKAKPQRTIEPEENEGEDEVEDPYGEVEPPPPPPPKKKTTKKGRK